MSTWTEVTGIIICDWFSFSYPDKDKVKNDFVKRQLKINKVLHKGLPSGSETKLQTGYVKNNINRIIITGSLRDFNNEDINNIISPWWNYIIENLGFIRQAVMSCTCNRKTHIFEKRIAHDADLGEHLLELYGSDPGIIVHSNREVNKI